MYFAGPVNDTTEEFIRSEKSYATQSGIPNTKTQQVAAMYAIVGILSGDIAWRLRALIDFGIVEGQLSVKHSQGTGLKQLRAAFCKDKPSVRKIVNFMKAILNKASYIVTHGDFIEPSKTADIIKQLLGDGAKPTSKHLQSRVDQNVRRLAQTARAVH